MDEKLLPPLSSWPHPGPCYSLPQGLTSFRPLHGIASFQQQTAYGMLSFDQHTVPGYQQSGPCNGFTYPYPLSARETEHRQNVFREMSPEYASNNGQCVAYTHLVEEEDDDEKVVEVDDSAVMAKFSEPLSLIDPDADLDKVLALGKQSIGDAMLLLCPTLKGPSPITTNIPCISSMF